MTAMLSLIDSKKNGTMDRQKALDAALAQIDRAFGKGSAMKLGSREKLEIEAISTGSLGLDIALGIGGLPKGRIIEIYGPESSGKTTLALHAIAEAQKIGGTEPELEALLSYLRPRSCIRECIVDMGMSLLDPSSVSSRSWAACNLSRSDRVQTFFARQDQELW